VRTPGRVGGGDEVTLTGWFVDSSIPWSIHLRQSCLAGGKAGPTLKWGGFIQVAKLTADQKYGDPHPVARRSTRLKPLAEWPGLAFEGCGRRAQVERHRASTLERWMALLLSDCFSETLGANRPRRVRVGWFRAALKTHRPFGRREGFATNRRFQRAIDLLPNSRNCRFGLLVCEGRGLVPFYERLGWAAYSPANLLVSRRPGDGGVHVQIPMTIPFGWQDPLDGREKRGDRGDFWF